MERRLFALAVVIGVTLGAAIPGLLSTFKAQKSFTEEAVEMPKAVSAPQISSGLEGSMVVEEGYSSGFLLAFTIPIILALLAFIVFNMLLKKG